MSITILKTPDYERGTIRETVERQFALLELDKKITPDMRVVIKPNLLMKRKPDQFTTTHPMLVECIAAKLKQLGVKSVVIADSPGGPYTRQALMGIYEASGMNTAAKNSGAEVNLNFESRMIRCDQGILCKEFELIEPIADADFIINVAKLKTHCMTTLSGAVKNLFGCIPGLKKPQLHYRFPQVEHFSTMLVDLSVLVAPQVTFVDAVDAMEGDGPSSGEKRHLGLVLASDELHSLDLAICKMIGFDPRKVPTVKESIKRGLCPNDPDKLTVLGDTEEYKKHNYKKPATKSIDFSATLSIFIRPLVRRLFEQRPRIDVKRCIGCRKCAESCPAQIIRIENKRAVINYPQCIKCYCCHEMCPIQAISVKKGLF